MRWYRFRCQWTPPFQVRASTLEQAFERAYHMIAVDPNDGGLVFTGEVEE